MTNNPISEVRDVLNGETMSDISKIPALEALFKIIKCENDLERECRFFAWKNKWIVPVKKHQLVMNRSTMSSGDHDFTCEHLAKLCVDDLFYEGAVDIEMTQNSYTATILAVKNGKLEKN